MKKLPLGIQTFSEIITNNYLYIDKTKQVLELIENGKYYFLSRPRRFGKSLFLDTLQCIFEGKKELFKGLYIYDKYDFETYPVIKIAFGGDLLSPERLREKIKSIITISSDSLNIDNLNTEQNYDLLFQELIHKAYVKYEMPVIILIDEYDKPILDVIEKTEIAKANREILKSFYTVIKDNDKYVKFAFLTGVSKFSKVSIFSGLNNLTDITLDKRYATIAGYTQNDIETTFKEHLADVDLDKLKEWYDGYNFNGERVYNPYDILLFIDGGFVYKNYWFATGTPSFLVKLLGEHNYYIPQLENLATGGELIDSFDIEKIRLEPILFQSGYLTLDCVTEKRRGGFSYSLRVPNKEVQMSLNDIFINYLTDQVVKKTMYQDKLYDALADIELPKFKQALISLFDSIPYNNYVNNKITNFEGYYASVIYAYIASLGLRLIPEDVTNHGRIDLTIFIENKIYVLEFKVGKENALAQIKSKKYHEKYLNEYKQIILLGINFDEDTRNISNFEYDRLLATKK